MTDRPLSPSEIAADHLIGNLYLDMSLLPLVAGRLAPEAMPNTPAATVYDVMFGLAGKNNQRLTAGAVEAGLRAGGFDFGYLDNLQARIIPEGPEALLDYVAEINNAADLRRLSALTGMAHNKAEEPTARADALVGDLLQSLTTIRRSSDTTLRPISEIGSDLAAQIERWRAGLDVDGYPTGFYDIDRVMSLRPSELIVLAARPSMGKSALAFQWVFNVAKYLQEKADPGQVLIFSAEMSSQSVALRMACAHAGVNGERIQRRFAKASEYTQVQRSLEFLRTLPIVIDETSRPTSEQVFYRTAMENAKRPVRMVVFDFVELGGDEARNGAEELRVSAVARNLKAVAKSFNIPVVALSQLSRGVEASQDKLPSLADLRYSGMLEAVADKVVFLMRPEYYLKRNQSAFTERESDKSGTAFFIIAKNRNGPIGTQRLTFLDQYARFENQAVVEERSMPSNRVSPPSPHKPQDWHAEEEAHGFDSLHD